MQPSQIEKLFDEAPAHYEEEHQWLFRDFKTALNRGEIRAAEPDASTKSGWRANAWVKKGILLGFRMRSEEHTSELQSHSDLVCRLLLEKKKKKKNHE